MVIFLPAARHLRSKLNTVPFPSQKVSSLSYLSSGFGVNFSKIGKILEHNRGYHFGFLKKLSEEEGQERLKSVLERVPDGKLFETVKKKVFDDPGIGEFADRLVRNTMRRKFNNRILEFGALESLLGMNLAWLQLVLVDENRFIQEQVFESTARVRTKETQLLLAEQARFLFKETASCLLHDEERLIFSRSLVFKEYNGSIMQSLRFTSHDPVGGLKDEDIFFDMQMNIMNFTEVEDSVFMLKTMEKMEDEPCDMQLCIPCTEVGYYSLKMNPEEEFKYKPLGIRCTEVFMFIAGDYVVEDGGLNSREAVQKLLHDLNTPEGMAKIHGFDVVAGSAKVFPEKLAVLRDMHLTA